MIVPAWLRAHWVTVAVAGLALLLALVLVRTCFGPPPVPLLPPVTVKPDSVLIHDRPTVTPPTGIGKLARAPVVVLHRTVSAGTPDTAAARRYARLVFQAESLRAVVRRLQAHDSASVADTLSHPTAMLPPARGAYDGHRLDLYLTRSDGSIMEASAEVRPHWTFAAGGGAGTDTVPLIVGDRAWVRFARQSGKCALPTAVGAGLGAGFHEADRVAGGIVAGLVTYGACLIGGR